MEDIFASAVLLPAAAAACAALLPCEEEKTEFDVILPTLVQKD